MGKKKKKKFKGKKEASAEKTYKQMTIVELKAVCKKRGDISNFEKLGKADLVAVLEAMDVDDQEDQVEEVEEVEEVDEDEDLEVEDEDDEDEDLEEKADAFNAKLKRND